MGDVRAYQLHLVAQKLSWRTSTRSRARCGFFYGVTLGQKEAFERIVFGQRTRELPPVLDARRSCVSLEGVAGLRNRVRADARPTRRDSDRRGRSLKAA